MLPDCLRHFLKKLNQLKTVTLINCRLQNLDGLAGCYQLESLKLTDSGRELEDISTLFDLIENGKLRYIKINECFQVQEQIYQLEDGIALIDTGY